MVKKKHHNGTKVPRFDLIPRQALESLAARFELGLANYGELAWNAARDKEGFDAAVNDPAFVEARLNHVIDHATKALAKLRGHLPEDGDDDAGAIMFGGAVLAVRNRL